MRKNKLINIVCSLFLCFIICFAFSACDNSVKPELAQSSESTDIQVEYNYITYKKEHVLNSTYEYTFQIEVDNKTNEEAYIVKNLFQVKYIKRHSTSSIYYTDRTYDSVFNVYTDEEKENEITMSKTLQSEEKKTIYIVTNLTEYVRDDYSEDRLISVSILYNNQLLTTILCD